MARIHNRFSSPDPLNDDSYLSPAKPQSQSRSRSTEIISSKKKNNKRKIFELDVGNDISPQKIRVTVEAGNDEFDDVVNLQGRPISWEKKKFMVCSQPSNDTSNKNPRNKPVNTPKQTRRRSIKPASAVSNKKSVTKGKKSPTKKAAREPDEVKTTLFSREELDSDIGELSSGGKQRSLFRSRKSKATPQLRSLVRSPNKIISSQNVTSESKNEDVLEQGGHISLIYNTPQCTELSHKISACDNSDPEVVGPSNLQSQPLIEVSGMGRSENYIQTNPKLRLLANKSTDSQVAKNSNLYQNGNYGNYGAKPKSDPTYYPSPDSPEKFLDRNHEKVPIDSSKFQSSQYSKLQNLKDGKDLIESTQCSEYQESDTILESEEFSMISVDSVPSLIEHIRTSSRNNDLESLLLNLSKGSKENRPSEVSESLEKSKATDVNLRFMSEAHQEQINSLETHPEAAPKAIEWQHDHQDNNATSQKPREPSLIPELSQVSHTNNLTSSLDSDEEDLDLLLETINSATPSTFQQNSQNREPYELPSTPKLQNFGWSNSKITASNDKFFGSRISDKKELNQQTKIHQNNKVQESGSASRQSMKNSFERVNIFDYQIPQKSNFQPAVRKTRDSTHSSFLNVTPKRKLPAMIPNSNKSFQTCNSNTSIYEFQSSSNDQNISPSHQESRSRPQSKVNSLSTQMSQDIFSPRHTASFPISSNITNQSFDVSSRPNDYIYYTKFHDVDPSSSNQVVGCENQNKSSPAQFSTPKNNPDRNLNSTPRKQKPPTTPTSSPTKSCLRSPLKLQMERLAFPRSPSKTVTFVSSSATASPINDPPSAVTWTRNHWLILDKIAQRWKSESGRESSPGSETYSMQNHQQKPRRNSTRVVSQLLGKYVHSAESERMKLEQWHLEVVDEFRRLVPGWDEKVIAMRLFALLVGERVRAEREISQKR